MDFVHKFRPGKNGATVLTLHGSGGDEEDLLPIVGGIAPGAGVLSPRGSVQQVGQYRFFAFPGPDGFDADEVRERAAELAEWIVRATDEYGVDRSRLYALGFSNGANIASVLMLLHPGVIAGACLLRSRLVVPVPEVLPELQSAPVVISAGQSDPLIPAKDSELLARTLSKAGALVDYVVQNAAHDLTPADFSLAKQWFARLL